MTDLVNRPPHYTAGSIEFIEAVESMLTAEEFRGFLRGSAFKYQWRLGLKGDACEDTAKAQWFMERLRANLERQHEDQANETHGPDPRP